MLAVTVHGLVRATMFVYRARTVFEHQNGQLQDDKEQFAEFDKKCIRLVSWTVPLSDYYNPTTDFLHFT